MRRWVIAAVLCVPGVADAAVGGVPGFAPGSWTVRATGRPLARVCVPRIETLVQIAHGPAPLCRHQIVRRRPQGATFTYQCGSRGQGYTRVRVESPTIVHLETQGFVSGEPFQFNAEARRAGDCGR